MRAYSIKWIKARRLTGGGDSAKVIDRATGKRLAEVTLTPGRERSEIAAMRRTIDRHIATADGTLGNYQW